MFFVIPILVTDVSQWRFRYPFQRSRRKALYVKRSSVFYSFCLQKFEGRGAGAPSNVKNTMSSTTPYVLFLFFLIFILTFIFFCVIFYT